MVICFGRYIFVLGLPKCSFLVYIVLNKFPIFVKIHFYLFQKKCLYVIKLKLFDLLISSREFACKYKVLIYIKI